MRSSRLLQAALLTVLLILAIIIVVYYWQSDELNAIQVLPKYLMFLFLFYVLAQVLKRWLNKDRYWWDWIYYIGLASAMLPTFMASEESAHIFYSLTDYGTLFLIVPVLLDFYKLLKR